MYSRDAGDSQLTCVSAGTAVAGASRVVKSLEMPSATRMTISVGAMPYREERCQPPPKKVAKKGGHT